MADPLTPLAASMYAIADAGHPLADRLRSRADDLEVARRAYHKSPAPYDEAPLRAFTIAFSHAYALWQHCDGQREIVGG